MPDRPFRVLSLNGGGIRALFQAHFLDYVSKIPAIGPFWQDFDLIIGTSAGAIVAGALWLKKPASEIAHLFDTVGKDAFPQPLWNGLRITLRMAASGASFPNLPLKRLLTQVYGGETRLGDFARPTIAITATEIENSRIRVFSPITQAQDRDIRLVDAVMASAALPGVFSDYPVKDSTSDRPRHYIDGCLWGNAPLLAATALSLQTGTISLNGLRVVSIGTAANPYSTTSDQYRRLTVNSAPFYHCLFNLASSAAERVSFAVIDCLLKPEHVIHIDGALERSIKAWEIEAARKELPRLAESCANDAALLAKLRGIIA
jgi:uncharacterized protein